MTDFYQWATNRCSQKEYCRSELAQKLRTKGASPSEIELLLTRLEAERYIDESRYARAFVSDKFRFDRWGRIKITNALRLRALVATTSMMHYNL